MLLKGKGKQKQLMTNALHLALEYLPHFKVLLICQSVLSQNGK